MDLLAGPGEMPQVAVDREMPAFLFFVDVEIAGAVVDRALAAGRAGGEKQGVGKTGLARRPMTSEGDVPDILDVIGRGHGVDSPCIGTMDLIGSMSIGFPFQNEPGARTCRNRAFIENPAAWPSVTPCCRLDGVGQRESAVVQGTAHDATRDGKRRQPLQVIQFSHTSRGNHRCPHGGGHGGDGLQVGPFERAITRDIGVNDAGQRQRIELPGQA